MEGYSLEIVDGPGRGMTLPLRDGVEIGREVAADGLMVDDSEVSRRHAQITIDDDGVTIRDLGSTNGTHVNERPIDGPRRLTPEDRLRVGLTVLALKTPAEETAPVATVVPQVSRVTKQVLAPVPEEKLVGSVGASANSRVLLTDQSEPGFVSPDLVTEGTADANDQAALQHLVDTRVKRQTTIAAFALIAIAALAVIIVLGVA